MFSKTALSLHSQENHGSELRKLIHMKSLNRQPFLDRPVNKLSPVSNKSSKGENSLNSADVLKKQIALEQEFDAHDTMFSFKEKEDLECNVWLKTSCLDTEGIIQVLRNYCTSQFESPFCSPQAKNYNFIFENIAERDLHCGHEDIVFENIDPVDSPQSHECDLQL